MKRTLAFILSFCMLLSLMPTISLASNPSFVDFDESHWAYNLQIDGFYDKNPILTLVELGIVSGKDEGGVKYLYPDSKISRIEFLVMTLRARFGAEYLEYEAAKVSSQPSPFADCKGHWGEKYLKVAKKYEILANVQGSKFQPESTIGRGEMMGILLSNGAILPENITIKSGNIRFSDVSRTSPYYEYINHAYQAGLIDGPDGTFRPYDAGTRIEAMVIIAHYVGLMEKLEGAGIQDNIYLTTSNAQVYKKGSATVTAEILFPSGSIENVEWSVDTGNVRSLTNGDGMPVAFWSVGDADINRGHRITFSADYVWKSIMGETQVNPTTYAVETKQKRIRISKTLDVTVKEKPIPYIKENINTNLDKPLNIYGTLENSILTLTWDDVDASKYVVEKGTQLGDFEEVKKLSKTEYTVNIDAQTPSAYYRVVALDSKGNVTDQTGVVEVASILETPTATMVETPKYTFVVWNKVCGAEYYIVQRKLKGEADGAFYDVSDKITDRCYIDESAGEDYKLYDYRVCAYNHVLTTGKASNSVNTDVVLEYDDSDLDGDGLSNMDELKNKTSPYVNDSDMDGIPDGIEVRCGSYSYIGDSDGDEIDDGTEIMLGLDYLKADVYPRSCVATVTDNESGVEASVHGSLNVGEGKLKVKVSDNPLLKTMGDLVAEPVEIVNRTGINDVYVTIPLPETDIYGKRVNANTIAAYAIDRESKKVIQLKGLEIDKEKQLVTVNTMGYSIIIFAKESREILQSDFKEIDVIFTMDSSGSMSSSDPNAYRVEAGKFMVERFDDTKRVGLVEFDSYATVVSELESDMNVVKSRIETMNHIRGGTNIADGINASSGLFEDDARRHMVILLSDGQSGFNDSIEAARNANAQNNVVINTIALGRGADKTLLEEVANVTGGNAFVITDEGSHSEILTQMNVIYNQIFGDINLTEYNKLSYDYLIDFLGIAMETLTENSVYIYTDEDPADRLVIDTEKVNDVKNAKDAQSVLKSTIESRDEDIKEDPGVEDKLILTAEEVLSRASSTSSTSNKIVINDATVAPIYKNIKNMITDIEKLLVEAISDPDRDLRMVARYKTTSSVAVSITKDELTGDHTELSEVVVETPYVDVLFDTAQVTDLTVMKASVPQAVEEMIGEEEEEDKPRRKRVSVKVEFKEEQEDSYVSLALPGEDGDDLFCAVVDETGKPVGGKYNPATGVVEAKITQTGIYTVISNEKQFSDIKHRSAEVQEAIKVLASKGIINGTSETEFAPENSISRAEVAAIIVRTLSRLDPNADGGFTDVTRENWFYGVAGSSKKYGIINGFEDNTFRGNAVIAKDQLLVVSARVLINEMNYKVKDEEIEQYLGTYKDRSHIATWAQKEIALATKVNLVMGRIDGTFTGEENMTRGDAAIVLYRLFKKLW